MASNNILQVKRPIVHNDDIISEQFHTYTPYTTSFNNNDEIRITIQSQDLYVLSSESYLQFEFTVERKTAETVIANPLFFTNLFISFMFNEMRYELNGCEIDRCKIPGITSVMKLMIACKEQDRDAFELYKQNSMTQIAERTYRAILPLRFLFGFCEDFNRIVLNSKHELILVRHRSNVNMFQGSADVYNFNVLKIQWKVPHISLSDGAKLNMLKTISRNDDLSMPFRSWDLYELPAVPQTTRHTWSVKTTSQLNKPRFVVVAFQTNRNQVMANDISLFDHCNISNIKLYLNNERFPYDDLNINFTTLTYHELYMMFARVQKTYYNGAGGTSPLDTFRTFEQFLLRPLFAFDCSRTEESIKPGMVDVRLEIEASQNIPANTSAYCMIIHDNLVRYSPFTSAVHRDI